MLHWIQRHRLLCIMCLVGMLLAASFALLTRTLETAKTPQEGQIAVQFPAHEEQHPMALRILPLKDNEETVFAALILGESS